MPAEPRGEVRDGSARITWRGRERKTFPLPPSWTDGERQTRANVLAKMAASFRSAKVLDDPRAIELAKMAASADAVTLDHVLTVAQQLTGGLMPTLHKPDRTLRELAPGWVALRHDQHTRGDLAATTVEGNAEHLKMYVLPMLGDEPIQSFREGPARLRRFVRDLRARPKTRSGKNKTRVPIPGTVLSSIRVNNIASTLSQFFEDAIAEQWIKLATNPMRHPAVQAELPKAETLAKGDVIYLERSVVETMLRHETLDEERRQKYLFLVLTGLDIGEMAGLDWSHIDDLDTAIPTVHVERCFTRLNEYGPTKRPSRVRRVPLHPLLIAMLKSRREDQWFKLTGRLPQAGDPVFPGVREENGVKHVHPVYWHGAADDSRADLGRAECPTFVQGHPVTAKATRRSFSTWLYEAGVEETIRSRLLGHSKGSVTEKHYTGEVLKTLHDAVCKISLDLGGHGRTTSAPMGSDDPVKSSSRGDDYPATAPSRSPVPSVEDTQRVENLGSQLRDLNSRPTVYEFEAASNRSATLRDQVGAEGLGEPTRAVCGAIAGQSEARVDHDLALHFELRARATELAAALPQDAVERALADALSAAVAAGRYGEASELASALEARQRARASTVDLSAERARRGAR